MITKVKEGKAEVIASTSNLISRKLEVFYNPEMKYNRDLTIEAIDAHFKNRTRPIRVGLPLEGSGIRGVRFFLECKTPIDTIFFNDLNPTAIKVMKANTKQFKNKEIYQQKAQVFLYEKAPFDYIDVDPFGSSIPFIKAATEAIYNGGLLAITNTDTAALCGSYPDTCKRRYSALPYNHAIEQEFGIRILIKKAQEIALENDLALIPIISYSRKHYMRVFFACHDNKQLCKEIIGQHKYVKPDKFKLMEIADTYEGKDIYGPIWTGKLFDEKITSLIPNIDKYTEIMKEEAKINEMFFYDLHEICETFKRNVPNYKETQEMIKKKGFKSSRTTFCETAIKTNMPKKEFLKMIKGIRAS